MIADAGASSDDVLVRVTIALCTRELLAADVTPEYRAVLRLALALPGNILSDTPGICWARLAWTCLRGGCREMGAGVPRRRDYRSPDYRPVRLTCKGDGIRQRACGGTHTGTLSAPLSVERWAVC